ncbi:hypothetical protein cypCar_00026115 [Cyprinus carpio]|nr:hypothetical protein cypCar_00026115 [Cyprinus carpio]
MMDVTLFLSLVCVCAAAGSNTLSSSGPLLLSDALCQYGWTRTLKGQCRHVDEWCVWGRLVSEVSIKSFCLLAMNNPTQRMQMHTAAHRKGYELQFPRYENNLFDWDFDVELGNTTAFVRDDPAAAVVSCSFDEGLCVWMTDSEGDLKWEIKDDPAGGRYLSVPEAPNRRSVKGARLTVPLAPPTKAWQGGDLCLSFKHRLHGHHIGSLQVFVRKGRSHNPSIWTRTGGHGWRHAHITLWGRGLVDIVLKAERRRGKHGEIAVDDFSLRRGACSDGHDRTE